MSENTKRMTVRVSDAEYATVQFVELITSLNSNVSNLEEVTVTGFNSLISLTRGDNYLLDDD